MGGRRIIGRIYFPSASDVWLFSLSQGFLALHRGVGGGR